MSIVLLLLAASICQALGNEMRLRRRIEVPGDEENAIPFSQRKKSRLSQKVSQNQGKLADPSVIGPKSSLLNKDIRDLISSLRKENVLKSKLYDEICLSLKTRAAINDCSDETVTAYLEDSFIIQMIHSQSHEWSADVLLEVLILHVEMFDENQAIGFREQLQFLNKAPSSSSSFSNYNQKIGSSSSSNELMHENQNAIGSLASPKKRKHRFSSQIVDFELKDGETENDKIYRDDVKMEDPFTQDKRFEHLEKIGSKSDQDVIEKVSRFTEPFFKQGMRPTNEKKYLWNALHAIISGKVSKKRRLVLCKVIAAQSGVIEAVKHGLELTDDIVTQAAIGVLKSLGTFDEFERVEELRNSLPSKFNEMRKQKN